MKTSEYEEMLRLFSEEGLPGLKEYTLVQKALFFLWVAIQEV